MNNVHLRKKVNNNILTVAKLKFKIKKENNLKTEFTLKTILLIFFMKLYAWIKIH